MFVPGAERRESGGTDKLGLSVFPFGDHIPRWVPGQTKFVPATKDFMFVVFLVFHP
jgi:hypothetical protein